MVRVLMVVIAFTLGLGLAREDFARVARERRAVLVGMVAQTLIVPLLGFAVAAVFALDARLAVGLVVLCACPGGIHSNYYNKLARGDVALSMTLTSVSTVVNLGTLPLWVLAATAVFGGRGEVVTMPAWPALAELAGLVVLPMLGGMWLRAARPERAARVERGMMIASGTLLVLVIAASVGKQAALMAEHARRVGAPVLALQAAAMGGSYLFARAAGLPPAQRITVALEGGIQNATLAFAFAVTLTGDLSVAIPAIVYSVAIYFTAALLVPLGRATVPLPSA